MVTTYRTATAGQSSVLFGPHGRRENASCEKGRFISVVSEIAKIALADDLIARCAERFHCRWEVFSGYQHVVGIVSRYGKHAHVSGGQRTRDGRPSLSCRLCFQPLLCPVPIEQELFDPIRVEEVVEGPGAVEHDEHRVMTVYSPCSAALRQSAGDSVRRRSTKRRRSFTYDSSDCSRSRRSNASSGSSVPGSYRCDAWRRTGQHLLSRSKNRACTTAR